MWRPLLVLICLCTGTLGAQPLEDINYSYLYNEAQPFTFQFIVIPGTPQRVIYNLSSSDTTDLSEHYSIRWETRADLVEKSGKSLSVSPLYFRHGAELVGMFTFSAPEGQKYLAAQVLHVDTRRATYFFTALSPDFGAAGYLADQQGRPMVQRYAYQDSIYQISGFNHRGELFVTCYRHDFPAAPPPFSQTLPSVSRMIKPDTVYRVEDSVPVSFHKPGLYLVQADTMKPAALSFLVESDYPHYSHLENLPEPLTYICSEQEHKKLLKGAENKKAFDRAILDITGDADRARQFMRSYFRRVEGANRLFTSYKAGWKTDRGMMYIIFGEPDQVFRFDDREIWKYKGQISLECTFVRSSTIFDPNNYVLLRNQKFTRTWMTMVDLWRNARL